MKYVNRKAMIIRPSGRSSDYITPSFGFGCLYKCSYCYMRRHIPKGLTIAKNTEDLLIAIENHCEELSWPKEPNQTHEEYYTYDFSCNEDFVLHAKYHDWRLVFDYFRYHEKAMGTAATKYVNKHLLDYDAERKVRIRFSIMPQVLSTKLEPGTSKIIDRIKAVNDFYEAGYDVHLNYSPIVMYNDHKKHYNELFKLVDTIVDNSIKDKVKAECIFLTHNEKMHKYNSDNNVQGEDLLWTPEIQERKLSQYGNVNIRYKYQIKHRFINDFTRRHQREIPWQKIRYIF
jgi:spore photoproduct lyase